MIVKGSKRIKLEKGQVLYRTQIEFGLFHLQSSYWERLVRSRYIMVIQASERMSNVDRNNSNSIMQKHSLLIYFPVSKQMGVLV